MSVLPTPFLVVKDLSIQSASGAALVDRVSFDVLQGECLAVVGESGSGKTMAARALLGLLPAGVQMTAGSIHMAGEALHQATPARLRSLRGASIGMVFQEPMTSLNPVKRIGLQMAEGVRLHTQLNAFETTALCIEMLEKVEISDPEACMNAYPHQFSGGMRQRIMLASVMLLRPRLLLADEPTTALDTLTQRKVLDLMMALTREAGTSVVLVTHNLGLVARYAQRAIVMKAGQLVESASVHQILYNPSHAYTAQLVAALPRRLPAVVRQPAAGVPLIDVRGLAVQYPGNSAGFWPRRRSPGKQAVDGVDLQIQAGETLAVVGGSGSGKTTLGRAILQLVTPTRGEVLFRGKAVSQAARPEMHAFRLACQLVFQDPYSSLNPRMRIGAIIAEPLRHVPCMDAPRTAYRLAEVLEEVGLSGLQARFAHELSGGQRQRVAIARAIVRRPAFLVADEPVSALDMGVQAQILSLFTQLQRQHGFACLFISHDLGAVEQIADRVVVMQSGKIVEQGTRDAVFDHPQHSYTRALLDARMNLGSFSQSEPPK